MDRIELAHVEPFRLGSLAVTPAHREVATPAGRSEVIEPRMMQVLVMLAREPGRIVSRDDLVRACWQGRIVGDDAINRVLSRLRRVAQGIGGDSFRIETITKVGYRLVVDRSEDWGAATALGRETRTADSGGAKPAMLHRRTAMLGAAGLAAAAGVAWVIGQRAQSAPPSISPEVASLMLNGLAAYRQGTGDGDLQARGQFRRVAELAPDHAPGWAMLGFVYANETHYHAPASIPDLTIRARHAIGRALAIDPAEPRALVARAMLRPLNQWQALETAVRAQLARVPGDDILLQLLSRTLARVGRMAEAASALEGAMAQIETSPLGLFDLLTWQWAAGRVDDADRTSARALALFPRHFALWFGTYYLLLYTGRIDAAIAFILDEDNRPARVQHTEFDHILAIANALKSRNPAAIDAIIAKDAARVRLACGYAEGSIMSSCALGRIDHAFAVANAYFLGRGFTVPPLRFPAGQGSYTVLADRRTWYLFLPPAQRMWQDPRFAPLVEAIGLTRYWQDRGKAPDYRPMGLG